MKGKYLKDRYRYAIGINTSSSTNPSFSVVMTRVIAMSIVVVIIVIVVVVVVVMIDAPFFPLQKIYQRMSPQIVISTRTIAQSTYMRAWYEYI